MFDDDDDFESLKRKIRFEQVARTIKEDPKNWSGNLEKIGFLYFDDETDIEEEEEKTAKPENPDEELLVGYFEGLIPFSGHVLDSFLSVKESPDPNYPLLRKYFKSGNENLKKMLLYGLEKNPADSGLLYDLSYFHEFRNILGELIQLYLTACEKESDLEYFEELARDFHMCTEPDGYDALYELEQKYSLDSPKGKIIRKIKQNQTKQPCRMGTSSID
jgi:hypothetical protein